MDRQYQIRMGIRIYHRTTKGGYGMEQLGFNGFVKAIFDGYREAKAYNHNPFNELEKSYLLDVSDLNELCDKAKNKQQHEAILDHMYRFDATRVDYYKRIEKKIINRYWEG
jgi:hypothetical protein